MKYFTSKWWAGEVADTDAVVGDYERYIESIRSHLTPALRSLYDEVSLHDSKIRRFAVDIARQSASVVLHGFTDP